MGFCLNQFFPNSYSFSPQINASWYVASRPSFVLAAPPTSTSPALSSSQTLNFPLFIVRSVHLFEMRRDLPWNWGEGREGGLQKCLFGASVQLQPQEVAMARGIILLRRVFFPGSHLGKKSVAGEQLA